MGFPFTIKYQIPKQVAGLLHLAFGHILAHLHAGFCLKAEHQDGAVAMDLLCHDRHIRVPMDIFHALPDFWGDTFSQAKCVIDLWQGEIRVGWPSAEVDNVRIFCIS